MIKDYKFKDIEKYLKKDFDIDENILTAFSHLTDAAIIFSPIIFGPQFLPLLELLDVKDKLVDMGKKVVNFIASKQEPDYMERMEQIKAAYALICYTAYFDVLCNELPKDLRKKLKLKYQKKQELIEESLEDSECVQIPPAPDIHCTVYYVDHATSFSEIKEQLNSLYGRITNNILKLIVDATIFDDDKAEEKKKFGELKTSILAIPQKAINAYEAQYLSLADQFNDFAFFAQLNNFNGIQRAINQNGLALQKIADTANKIDVGFTNLNSIVNSIITNYNAIQAQDIVNDLKNKYNAIIEESIIDDKEIKSDTEDISLRFPKIVDAFVPQSYKHLVYRRKETQLESETVWRQLPANHDIDKFFIKYLYSPDSIDYPLLILGQPGSGKSLLTKVLSAQLMSDSYTVIRIPLREVNAEDGIDILVEDQIKKLTNRPLTGQGYGGFAMQFNEKPLIIILDGYDELLQAKGEIFSSYLEKVRTFQQDQKSMSRPVRVIVTSRFTLINKARVPENSTVLRLIEFNSQQMQTWITIWNNTNTEYFSNADIKPFQLPHKEKGKKNNIIELAEQPLLLLMLALYDSEANELAQTSNIKRTELYDNLLRRFVRRERRRYVPDFVDKTPKEQEDIIDKEMNRLGVVAIGMYNRQDVVILSNQLENDLEFFKARRADGSPEARTLKESESVLGGFFFIHKSTAQDVDANSDNSDSAFEFLHNTFGEFLAADFILRYTISAVREMYYNRKFNMTTSIEKKLSDPDSFDSGWFACLMFVPLYSRPVVIEMLKEHALKGLQRLDTEITQDDFIDNLKYIVQNQLKMVLNTRNSPSVMRNGILLDRDIPLLGYLSTYTLNLTILASVLCPKGFEFNENEYKNAEASELDSKPWDKLASLWKTWFSAVDLAGLSVILKAIRKSESSVIVLCNDKFEATRYEEPIDILLCVSSTIADNLFTGLAGLHTQHFCEIARMDEKAIQKMLESENMDLYFSYLIVSLRKEVNGFVNDRKENYDIRYNFYKINSIIENIINDEKVYQINSDTLLCLLELLENCVNRKILFANTRKMLIKIIPQLIDDSKINLKKKPSHEFVCGIRLIKLLFKDSGFLLYDRRMMINEPFNRDVLMGENWDEDIERIMHTFSKYRKNGRLYMKDYENIDRYQLSLLDAVEETLMMDYSDKSKIMSNIIKPTNIKLLVELNPELLSQTILVFIRDMDFRRLDNEDFLENFFDCCLKQLLSVGITYFGFNAIINSIKIAKIIHNDRFLEHISQILFQQLFDRHPRGFSSVINLYPKFVANLIEILPEMFSYRNLKVFEPFYLDKHIHYINPQELLDYIKIFRYFYKDNEMKNIDEKLRDTLRHLMKMTSNYDDYLDINIANLTMSQLSDLFWFAKHTDNQKLLYEIQMNLNYFNDFDIIKKNIHIFDKK